MPTRRSSREKLRGDDAIVWRMCWSCTDLEIAAFAWISPKSVLRIRYKLGIRKRQDYHKWKGTDFTVIRTARQNGYPATSALPSIGVSPKSLWNAIERNQHLAA